MHCRVCNSGDLDLVIDFGEQPLTHVIKRLADVPDKVFPLKVHCCVGCGLPQIVDSIDPEKLYTENDDYFTSDRAQPHAADEAASLLSMAKGNAVIEKVEKVKRVKKYGQRPESEKSISLRYSEIASEIRRHR